MSLLPRLCSGTINHHILATADVGSKSAFLYPRWRKIFKSCLFLTATSGKHTGGKNRLSCPTPDAPVKNENKDPSHASSMLKFDDMMSFRREQAGRSLIVQVQSEASCIELRDYCEKISPINCMFHYRLKNNHFVLVEFKEKCLTEIMRTWCCFSDKSSVPVTSPVVWFKAAPAGQKKFESGVKVEEDSKVTHIPPSQSYDTILNLTSQAQSVSKMMEILYNGTKLDELGTRLRFFTAHQLELAMSGLFPSCAVLPFGSSVNGFGKAGSDLDVVFRHDISHLDSAKNLRLVYQTKTSLGGQRPLTQRQMELMADLLQVLMPGCSSVKRILQARVPIVKYTNDITGLDCDLSMSNLSGVYMSELLFLFNQLDPLAKLVICFIKHWASASQLTNPSPGRWVTNFMLIMLCVHYLQSLKRLPPLDLMVKQAELEDERITDDINCTFVRDLSRLSWTPSATAATPSKLLRGFFDYYMNFDFSTSCVSITTGSQLSKPDYSPLYIINPLERSLNVAKNVSGEELERFRMSVRNAAWALESGDMPINALLTRLGQFNNTLPPLLHPAAHRRYAAPRMVTVKELFTDS